MNLFIFSFTEMAHSCFGKLTFTDIKHLEIKQQQKSKVFGSLVSRISTKNVEIPFFVVSEIHETLLILASLSVSVCDVVFIKAFSVHSISLNPHLLHSAFSILSVSSFHMYVSTSDRRHWIMGKDYLPVSLFRQLGKKIP